MNQQEKRENEIKTESLIDLPVTDEQADETKAATGKTSTLAVSADIWMVV